MTQGKRVGARSISQIPPDILQQIDRGEIETANLTEWLAVDQVALLEHQLHLLGRSEYLPKLLAQIRDQKKPSTHSTCRVIGRTLGQLILQHEDEALLPQLASHQSDMLRCWAAYAEPYTSLQDALKYIYPFAQDAHFGVREVAWFSLRPLIIEELDEALQTLAHWAKDPNEYIRRFASEATRPCGVWCEHITRLKDTPELGLPILTPLSSDPSRYVQNSVGNWLNDASKTQPRFVETLCQTWLKEHDCPETRYITKRALRSLNK
jgi:DNA alkylation repair enzyme family protein